MDVFFSKMKKCVFEVFIKVIIVTDAMKYNWIWLVRKSQGVQNQMI